MMNKLPLIAAILVMLAVILLNGEVLYLSENGHIIVDNLYAAVFDWSAIQTGFLFSVYGFIAGKSDGFIGAIRNTTSMQNFNVYVKFATVTGFLLTFTSLFMVMTSPDVSSNIWLYCLQSAWFALFIWAFLCFKKWTP